MQVSCEVMHLGSTWPRLVAQNREVALKCRRAAKTAPYTCSGRQSIPSYIRNHRNQRNESFGTLLGLPWVCLNEIMCHSFSSFLSREGPRSTSQAETYFFVSSWMPGLFWENNAGSFNSNRDLMASKAQRYPFCFSSPALPRISLLLTNIVGGRALHYFHEELSLVVIQ